MESDHAVALGWKAPQRQAGVVRAGATVNAAILRLAMPPTKSPAPNNTAAL